MTDTTIPNLKDQEQYVNGMLKTWNIQYEINVNDNNNLLTGMFLILAKLVPLIPGLEGSSGSGSGAGGGVGVGEWQEVSKKKINKDMHNIRKDVRHNGDIADFAWQRGQKGNFIISSLANKAKGVKSQILPESDLPKGVTYEDHILKLIKQTYGVVIPQSDIQACHPLGENSAIIKIWNRRPGSAFHKLVLAVKCGGVPKPNLRKSSETIEGGAGGKDSERGKGEEKSAELGGGAGAELGGGAGVSGGVSDGLSGCTNKSSARVFINFHLTRKRYILLGHLKQSKKEKKIYKFFTNENGDIFVKINQDSKKMLLTIDQNLENSFTYTPADFDNFLKSQ